MTIDVGLRFDIDTVKDGEKVPQVIELLDEYGMKGTFFITTGVDSTHRNFRHYLYPVKLPDQVARYGIRQLFRGLLSRERVERTESLKTLINSHHEIGLHGHDHFAWMNHLDDMDRGQITGHFQEGIRSFEQVFGYPPRSFASPGFKTNPLSLEIMEGFDFRYASDFMGKRAFPSGTLQVPVALPSFGELAVAFSDEEILDRYKEMLDLTEDFCVYYFHPSYEPVFKRGILKKLLYHIKDNKRFRSVTMSQIADEKGRDRS